MKYLNVFPVIFVAVAAITLDASCATTTEISSVYAKQNHLFQNISISFHGEEKIFYTFETDSLRSKTTYYTDALQGKLNNCTLSDVNVWIDKFGEIRERQIDFTFISDKKSMKFIQSCKAGDYRPWAELLEIVINDNTSFRIEHMNKDISVSDSEIRVYNDQYTPLINPISFIYPLLLLEENELPHCETTLENGCMKIQWERNAPKKESPNEIGVLTRMETILDIAKNGIAQKTLLIFKCFNTLHCYLYIGSAFKNFDGMHFPSKLNFTLWKKNSKSRQEYIDKKKKIYPYRSKQLDDVSDSEYRILPFSTRFRLEDLIQNNAIPHKNRSLQLSVKELKRDIELEDNYFWPQAKEGYQYVDWRERYAALRYAKSGENILFHGVGPHAFAK